MSDPLDAPADVAIARLDSLATERADALFRQCSHSHYWAARMLALRPYRSWSNLRQAAASSWAGATDATWLEAFAGHPEIGDIEYLRRRFDARAHQEQGQVLAASTATLEKLAALNREYRAKHGFIFIIRAAGRSADEMLEALQMRLDRTRLEELTEAARQHAAITLDRLTTAVVALDENHQP